MQRTEISNLLQSLRGAQPTIVLAYLMIRQAMSIEELELVTGLDNDTVRKAVKGLEAKGKLFKQVGAHGRQLWVPMNGTFLALEIQNPKFSDSDG